MRIASGIRGLDEIIDGGIPENFVVLLTGEVGTGKTIFGLQFLCSAKEPGVYMSLEKEVSELRETSKSFGWDAERLEQERRLNLVKFDPYRLEDVLEVIENSIREIKARRIVIDSISTLGIYVREISELRHIIIQLGTVMENNRCTALLTSEIPHQGTLSRFGVEEFVSDGVIVLGKSLSADEYVRTVHISKMRMSNHSKKIYKYDITKEGIVITK